VEETEVDSEADSVEETAAVGSVEDSEEESVEDLEEETVVDSVVEASVARHFELL
jgi:hypothetical protein